VKADHERRVLMETCQNFRDLGGYPTEDGRRVRWGVLYRADTLHRLNGADLQCLVDRDVQSIIDLRSSTEVSEHGRVQLGERAITYHHLPMIDETQRAAAEAEPREMPTTAGEAYVLMKNAGGAAIAQAIRLLAAPGGLPAVFHCMAGKDRTGILAGVVLSAVGVSDEDVIADYLLTADTRAERDAYLAEHDPDYLVFLDSLPPGIRDVVPESMQTFLDVVRQDHGSMHGFLTDVGVTQDVVEQLKSTLLEPAEV
jgi:protein tyrosine/serine phosphatase